MKKKNLTNFITTMVFLCITIVLTAQDSSETSNAVGSLVVIGLPILVIAMIIFLGVFTVEEKHVAIIERLGKYHSIRNAGLNFKIPFIDSIADVVSLQIDELPVEVETKTKDNVFVNMKISVQRQITEENVYKAHYELYDSNEQMSSYIFDTIRAEVPKLTLDELFEKKDDIADAVQENLKETMGGYGFVIRKALITEISPADEVKEAMNKINATERLKKAAENEAEADKIRMVKRAEAESESKKLQGQGIANQRKEIAAGLKESAESLKGSLGEGVSMEEIMHLLMTTQYYDALKDIASNDKTNTIFLPHAPGGLRELTDQIMTGQMIADAANKK